MRVFNEVVFVLAKVAAIGIGLGLVVVPVQLAQNAWAKPAQYAYLGQPQQIDVPAEFAKQVAAWAGQAAGVDPNSIASVTIARSGEKVIAAVRSVSVAEFAKVPAGVTLLGPVGGGK